MGKGGGRRKGVGGMGMAMGRGMAGGEGWW